MTHEQGPFWRMVEKHQNVGHIENLIRNLFQEDIMTRIIGKMTLLLILLSTINSPAVDSKMKQDNSPIDVQVAALVEAIEGKRVALLTNPTGVDGELNLIADRIEAASPGAVVAFFAPEHGLRGDRQAGAGVDDYVDPITGIPVYSLYRVRSAPEEEHLEGVDVLIFDIQDVGARIYTYVCTMTRAMEAAAQYGVDFMVFDRPNPIGAHIVQGPPNIVDNGNIGRLLPGADFGVPLRHGLTPGELATLVNEEWMDPKVNLQVIPIPGYKRDMWFEEMGRYWVLPSPNIPTLETALIYPGMVLFEGSNVSEGRGTTKPFEMIGAPYINGVTLAQVLNQKNLPGVLFRPAYFQPSFEDYAGQFCGGVQVHVSDRETFEAVRTGMTVLKTVYELYPTETTITSWASRLMGLPDFHERIKTDSVDDIMADWQANLNAYMALRNEHLLYGSGKTNWEVR
jgi:uncharacterized protein YbbC (DUF1343 family)